MKTQKAVAKKAPAKKIKHVNSYVFSTDMTPFCCGVIEVGELDVFTESYDEYGEYDGKTQEETQQELKAIIKERAFGIVSFPSGDRLYNKWYRDIIEDGFKVLYKARPKVNPQTGRRLTTVIFVNK